VTALADRFESSHRGIQGENMDGLARNRLPRCRAHVIGVVLLLLSGGLTQLPAAVAGAEEGPEGAILLADPLAPPGALSPVAREPVLAVLDENGVRDPDSVPLTLDPKLGTPGQALDSLEPLPHDGGPNADVFGLGPNGGDHVAAVYTEDVNSEDVSGQWVDLPELAVGDAGWSATVAGVTVTFPSTLDASNPVSIAFPGGAFSAVPVGVAATKGELAKDAVTYADALPHTDLTYSLTLGGYVEQIVLKTRQAPSHLAYDIVAPGMELAQDGTGGISVLADGVGVATIPPPFAYDASPAMASTVGGYGLSHSGANGWTLTLEPDPAFLERATYPVTIDPSPVIDFGANQNDTYADSGSPSTDFSTSAVLAVGGSSPTQHSFIKFDVSSLQQVDRLVYAAQMWLLRTSASGGAAVSVHRVAQAWPSPLTWNDQPAVGDLIVSESDPCCPGGWLSFETKAFFQHVIQANAADPWANHGLRLSTSAGSAYSYKSANAANQNPLLQVVYNDLPPAPTLAHPADAVVVEHESPTLKVEGGPNWPLDPNEDEVFVQFQISDSATDFTGNHLVWESPWQDERAYVVPSGILVDGQTYHWRARSWDVCSEPDLMCSLTDGAGIHHEQFATTPRSFTIALKHFGDDPRWAMWSHDVGNGMALKANESNGNVFLDVPLDTLATAIGDLSIGLSYNSQRNADYGLSPGWDLAIGPSSSARELPVALEKMDPFPDGGVKIRLGGGRTVYFPHREKGTFAAVGAGAGIVKQNVDGATPADRTFLYTTPDGSTYTFTNGGRLIEANPVSSQPAGGANSIDYTFAGGHLTQVTDPLGRDIDLVWGSGKLQSITSWAGQTWTFAYNPANGRLNTVSVQVTNPSTSPPTTVTESLGFSYHVGGSFPGGLLAEIDDGVTSAMGRTGWTLTYVQDANGNARVSTITAPPGGAPTTPTPWTFQYSGTLWGTTQATACVTDPLGTPGGDPPPCDGAHMTKVDFNTAGLPVRIAGPADQTGYWPVQTLIWDSNNNLICERTPAANAVAEISSPNPCQNDALSTKSTYQTTPPYRLLTTTDPAPNPGGSGTRRLETLQYDSDTAGVQWNGLWLEKYENRDLVGVPNDETVWSNFDANWGSGSPPGLTSTDNFSLRFSGYLNLQSWSSAKRVAFRLTTADEGATLIVGNSALLDCVGTTQPQGTYNCGESTDVTKKLWPGMRPITIEYAELTGNASFKLEWDQGTGDWQVIPASKLQTNLGLLTARTIGPASGTGSDSLKTTYTFPDDDAKARQLPASVTLKDIVASVTRQTDFTYNTYGQVRTITTAAGTPLAATTTNTYTNDGTTSCLTSVVGPTGAETTFLCDPAGDVTQSTQIVRSVPGTNQSTLQNRVTATEYDSLGRVTEVTEPSGGSTLTRYDLAGRPIQVDRYLGTGAGHDAHAFTDLVYDDAGRLTDETLPAVPDQANPGQTIRPTVHHVVDWLDDETSTTDVRGEVWQTVFDAFRRPIQTTSPAGLVSSTEYRLWTSGTGYDRRTTTWTPPGNPSGVATVTKLNVLGWTTSEQTGTITATTYSYDLLGNMTQRIDPAGVRTSFSYNGFSQATQRIDFYLSTKAATTTFTYDAAGRAQTENGPRTDVDDSLTYGYDLAGRLTSVTQNGIVLPGTPSTPVTTSYVYDDADERIQIVQPMSSSQSLVRNWSFDPVNRTSSYADARGTTTFTANPAGWTEQVADPRGITLRFEYDNLGRRTRRYATSGLGTQDDQTFSYDLAGNLLAATVVSTGTAIRADYDDDGRLWHTYQGSYPTPTTTYAYHASTGRLASTTDPAGTTSYAYNADGLLADLTDPFSATHAVYTYDSAGRITRRTDGGGVCTTQTYESGSGRADVRRIRKVGTGCNGTILATFDLGYDVASNVNSRAESITGNAFSGTYAYTYDAAGRMLTATGPAAFGSRTYTFDGAGNRTGVQIGTDPQLVTTYDDAGLPTSSSDGTTYAHDPAGELTGIDRPGGSAFDWWFSYGAWGQVTVAERTPGSSDVLYTTDALDRVLSRTSGGATASFTYAGLGEALASAVVGATTTLYGWTPGGPLAQKVGSTTRYYLGDQHGDTVGWTDTTGTLKGTALYDPWGQVLSATGEMASPPAQGAFGFQSDLTDPSTGQVDMGVRSYEPTLGRFSSPDPLLGDPASPPSLNRFTYAVGNPVTLSDPTGLCPHPDECPPPPTFTAEQREDWFAVGEAMIQAQQGSGASPPAVAESVEGRPPRARVLDWVASGSDLGWSRYLIGERDPLIVFAALINGIDCETGIGCAPVNPGAVGVSLTATLTFRSPLRAGETGWELRGSVAALLNRLNPQSGYELQKLRLIIVDASGSPIPVQPVVEGPMVTSTGLHYTLQIHIPADLPQPRRVIATAWAFPSEMNRQPITAHAEVVFDATPLVYGPFPS
jgi:RHS repeat-associated protein